MLASYWNRIPVVRLLLTVRASTALYESPNAVVPGRTAIMSAAARDNEEVVELLLEHGASTDATDVHGRTALDHAAPNVALLLLR